MEIGHELGDLFVAGPQLGVFGRGVDLHAIAGREQHRLDLREAFPQALEGLADLHRTERQPLANRDRRMMVAAADHLQFHAGPPVRRHWHLASPHPEPESSAWPSSAGARCF